MYYATHNSCVQLCITHHITAVYSYVLCNTQQLCTIMYHAPHNCCGQLCTMQHTTAVYNYVSRNTQQLRTVMYYATHKCVYSYVPCNIPSYNPTLANLLFVSQLYKEDISFFITILVYRQHISGINTNSFRYSKFHKTNTC